MNNDIELMPGGKKVILDIELYQRIKKDCQNGKELAEACKNLSLVGWLLEGDSEKWKKFLTALEAFK